LRRTAVMSIFDEPELVVLLDSHPLWLDAIEDVLRRVRVETIGKATAWPEALALVESAQPDLLVCEIGPGVRAAEGRAGLRRAHELDPALQSIVLAEDEDAEAMNEAFAAGAGAYVVKTAQPEDIAFVVRHLRQQCVYLAAPKAAPRSAVPRQQGVWQPLTQREAQILRLVAAGRSNPEIAKTLWVSKQTVKFHLANIFRKLGVTNRTEAAMQALAHGVVTNGDAAEGGEAKAQQG
jgi:DNA-binding NarL/FixJ family response regulator